MQYDKLLEQNCLFCEPDKLKQADQILLKSDNFYLFAGLGPITDGYIIITSYSCGGEVPQRSCSDFSDKLLDELHFLRGLVARFYRDRYQHPGLSFEHGRAGSCLTESGGTKHCYHPHLCCYPAPHFLWEEIDEFSTVELTNIFELRDAVGTNPYLYLEACFVDKEKKDSDPTKEKWHSRVVLLPGERAIESQFLRRKLADKIGKPELWDWATHSQKEKVLALVVEFKNWLVSVQEDPKKRRYHITDGNAAPRLDFLRSVAQSNATGNDEVSKDFHDTYSGYEMYTVIGRFLKWLPDPPVGEEFKKKFTTRRPRILDVGFGPGNYTRIFDALGFHCCSIDISCKMFTIAQDQLRNEPTGRSAVRRAPSPSFIEMDTAKLAFAPESFDGVWYSAVFVHIPKAQALQTIEDLFHIVMPKGIVYISAQIGTGTRIQPEGRVFYMYTETELIRMFSSVGFEVIDIWSDQHGTSSRGADQKKFWCNFILRKPENLVNPKIPNSEKQPTLGQLGERKIIEYITNLVPRDNPDHVFLDIGDDCAAFTVEPGEVVVTTTDPCPQPVITLMGDVDYWYYGWFSIIISVSDLASMGARPLGILLSIEARNDMTLHELDRFYEGALEASRQFDCPIVGGNIKDRQAFNCVGSAFGAVKPDEMLRRRNAQPGQHLVVVGNLGHFWVGVLNHFCNCELDSEEVETYMKSLKTPKPTIKEARAIATKGLSKCAMDCSDGLIACFFDIATASKNVDVHVDLANVEADPLLEEAASLTGIDVRKLMLSWGDWQLVCTVNEQDLTAFREIIETMENQACVVGWVSKGDGTVWYHDQEQTGKLNYIAGERFSPMSYFSHGIEGYIEMLRREPLYHSPNQEHNNE